jgi:hypothetical protein
MSNQPTSQPARIEQLNELTPPKTVDIRDGFIACLGDKEPEKWAESLLQAINEKKNSAGGTPEEWFKAVDDVLGQLAALNDVLHGAINELGKLNFPRHSLYGYGLETELSREVSEWIEIRMGFLKNIYESTNATAKILAEARYSRAETEAREKADKFLASLEHDAAYWYRADNADTGTRAGAAVGPARDTESFEEPKSLNDTLSQLVTQLKRIIGDNPAPAENTTTGKQVGIPVDSETLDLIRRLAAVQGVSEATALKKALTEAEFFYNTVQDGGRLLVEKNKKFSAIRLKALTPNKNRRRSPI